MSIPPAELLPVTFYILSLLSKTRTHTRCDARQSERVVYFSKGTQRLGRSFGLADPTAGDPLNLHGAPEKNSYDRANLLTCSPVPEKSAIGGRV